MKITGYALREALKQHELRRDAASRSFNGTLKSFTDESKETPQAVMEVLRHAERCIARLQVAQMRYNLAVTVPGGTMLLAEAIKLIGGIGRAEKMWRTVAGPKEDRYSSYHEEDVRDPTKIRASSTITVKEAVALAAATAKESSQLRESIAIANATSVEVEGLDASLFE